MNYPTVGGGVCPYLVLFWLVAVAHIVVELPIGDVAAFPGDAVDARYLPGHVLHAPPAFEWEALFHCCREHASI